MQFRYIIFTAIVSSLLSISLMGLVFLALSLDDRFLSSAITENENIEFAEGLTAGTSSSAVIPDMVERVNEAVVSVVITKDVPIYEQYYEEFNPWSFWGGVGGFSIPRVREKGIEEQEVGGGSGFIVSENGLVVTNRHVVDDKEARYSILTNKGDSYEVEVLARDTQLDVAILQITDLPEEKILPYVSFGDSQSLRLGETVVAIGNALGEFRNSVSVGVISGVARSITASDSFGRSEKLEQVIQTDAAINPGNSGGPLLNLKGEVIGVNVATSRGADNIGFALPAHLVEGIVTSVEENGKIVRPYIGVRYLMIDERVKELNNLTVDYGALVARGESREELAVILGSPADTAGITENDIILSVDGEELRNIDLASSLRTKKVGDTVKLKVLTKGKEKELNLVLREAP